MRVAEGSVDEGVEGSVEVAVVGSAAEFVADTPVGDTFTLTDVSTLILPVQPHRLMMSNNEISKDEFFIWVSPNYY